MTTTRPDGRDANFHMSPVAKGRPRPDGIGDRVAAVDFGLPRDAGITSMKPIAAAPPERRSDPLSPAIHEKLKAFPEQRARIRDVERRK